MPTTEPPSTPSGGLTRHLRLGWRIGPPVLLLALLLGLYWNALSHPFVWDDDGQINHNPDVRQSDRIWALWTHSYWQFLEQSQLFRPVTTFSLHVTRRVTVWPPAYRVTNLVLLTLLGGLVAALAAPWCGRRVAWILAFLVVVHPTNHSLVNQIVGRADIMSLIGILGFLLMQRRALAGRPWTPVRVGLAALLVLFAAGSKETGVLVGPLALLQVWCTPRALRRAWRHAVLLTLVPLALFGAVRVSAVGVGVDDPTKDLGERTNPLQQLALAERVPGALPTATFYARQIVWPDLGFYHHPDVVPGWGPGPVTGGLIVLVVAALLGWLVYRRSSAAVPVALAAGQWLVVSNLLFPIGTWGANRLVLPFTLAVGLLLARALGRLPRRAVGWPAAVLGAVLLIAMGRQIRWVNPYWSSLSETARLDVLLHPDSSYRWSTLGELLVTDANAVRDDPDAPSGSALKMYAEAEEWLRRALEREPCDVHARLKLAEALLGLERHEAAKEHLTRILADLPDPPELVDIRAECHRGCALIALGAEELDAAERHIEQAEALMPGNTMVRMARIKLLEARGDDAGVIEALQALIAAEPSVRMFRRALHGFGMQLLTRAREHGETGRLDAAEADLTLVLQIRPHDVSVWYNRAMARAQNGRSAGARDDLDEVIRRQPYHVQALVSRGELSFRQKAYHAAVMDWRRAIELIGNPAEQVRLQKMIDDAVRHTQGN